MIEEHVVVIVVVTQLLRIFQEAAGLNRPRVVLVAGTVTIPVWTTSSVDGTVSGCYRAIID